jgi:transposase
VRRNDSGPFFPVVTAADLCLKRGMNVAAWSAENARRKALLAQTQAALAEHQAALAEVEEARRRLEVIVGELRRDKFGANPRS